MHLSFFRDQLRAAFRLDDAGVLTTEARSEDAISVIELRSDAVGTHRTEPLDAGNATLVCVHLRDVGCSQSWQDDRSDGPFPVSKGACTFHDLRRSGRFLHEGAFHILAFVLPGQRATGAGSPGECRLAPGARIGRSHPVDDAVLFGLAISLLPFLDGSVAKNQAFIEYALRAAAVHVAAGDKVAASARTVFRGGLAAWQQQRAQDLLRRHLVEGISLDAVATACRLSKSGFLRAFRESLGVPPHQWLLRCRIDRASELMRDPGLSLSEIAVRSGFFDQSHFTRAFSQRVGLSPGAWRRAELASASGHGMAAARHGQDEAARAALRSTASP